MRTDKAECLKDEIKAFSINTKNSDKTHDKGDAECIANITYGVTEETYSLSGNIRKAYGIAAYFNYQDDGTATILASVNDITSEREKLEELVQICNRSELSLIHLNDVIEDFLAN